MNKIRDAISVICSEDAELEAITALLKSHNRKYERSSHTLRRRTACLRAINKIAKKDHNIPFMNLSDMEDEE